MLKNCAQAAAAGAISVISQGAAMALNPVSAERTTRRARRNPAVEASSPAALPEKRRRLLKTALAQNGHPSISDSAAKNSLQNSALPNDAQIGLLWLELQGQLLNLLAQGVVAPFQQRAFDRLDYSMKQYGRLLRERAEEQRGTRADEPDADELAAILDKIDRRIDALAEDRFKNLVGGGVHATAMDEGRAGMDV
jgi:hypothetical protein